MSWAREIEDRLIPKLQQAMPYSRVIRAGGRIGRPPKNCGTANSPIVQETQGADMTEAEQAQGFDPANVEFGKRLAEWRTAQAVTPQELAELVDTRVVVISGWESGEKKCREPHRTKVLDLMAGRPTSAPRHVGPPPGLILQREKVDRLKLTVDEETFARMLNLPAGDKTVLKVFGCDKKLVGFPWVIEAEVITAESVPEPKADKAAG